MKTQTQIELDLNQELAKLLGWTELFQTRGALIGRPPGGSPTTRDQCMAPNWIGNFNDCCELGLSYRITPHQASIEAFMYDLENEHGIKLDFLTAYRHFMVKKVMERLKDAQEAEKLAA
jgi:hypothetical protein